MTRVFENLRTGLFVKWKRNLPGLRVDVRVFDCDFVLDRVGSRACEAFDDPRRIALCDAFDTAARQIGGNPALAVEVLRFHDERIVLPMTARLSVPASGV